VRPRRLRPGMRTFSGYRARRPGWVKVKPEQWRRIERKLRPPHEVQDENDEQNNHEDSDQSIACPCDGEHVSSFVVCRLHFPQRDPQPKPQRQ
jgi:hypothetical protein